MISAKWVIRPMSHFCFWRRNDISDSVLELTNKFVPMTQNDWHLIGINFPIQEEIRIQLDAQ